LFELVILRSLININFHAGIEPMVVIAPGVALFLVTIKWQRTEQFKIDRKTWLLWFHFVCLGVFVFYSLQVSSLSVGFKRILWIPLAAAVFFSSFFYSISLGDFFRRLKKEKQDWLPFFLMGASFLSHYLCNDFLWIRGQKYFYLLLLTTKNVLGEGIFQVIYNPSGPILKMPFGSLKILSGCSGFEGICIFFFLWGLILLMDGKKITLVWKWISPFLGIAYMLVLNLIRILLIVYVGMHQMGRYSGKEIIQKQVALFHGQFAWGIYWVGLLLFFSLFYCVLSFKKTPDPNEGSAQ
jgi:exosortase/archaeosortase family protein